MPGAAKGAAWGHKYPLHGLPTKAIQAGCGSSLHWSAIRFGVTKFQSDNKEETIPFQWYRSGQELVRVSLKRLLMSLNFATNTGRAYFSLNWNCFNIVFLASKYERLSMKTRRKLQSPKIIDPQDWLDVSLTVFVYLRDTQWVMKHNLSVWRANDCQSQLFCPFGTFTSVRRTLSLSEWLKPSMYL